MREDLAAGGGDAEVLTQRLINERHDMGCGGVDVETKGN